MIDGHGKCGELEEATTLLEEMKINGYMPDLITYNALINCFCKFGMLHRAFGYLNEMGSSSLNPNIVTYSSFIDAFRREGMMQKAIFFWVKFYKREVAGPLSTIQEQ
ncbi:hypothetical protein KSP40_PGU017068 [Platanthera guangdongensis]|uniref:Pentatricopeptide repeat-containing protein n=1 Tax=Platanthera guangdongensis TaxID=2320717 RepID=A0ABR2LZ05_9ASPA